MKLTFLTMLCALAWQALAAPGLHKLQRRNPCDEVGVSQILYHPYHGDSCPPRFNLEPEGYCEMKPTFPICSSFCEQETVFSYVREQPFQHKPFCH